MQRFFLSTKEFWFYNECYQHIKLVLSGDDKYYNRYQKNLDDTHAYVGTHVNITETIFVEFTDSYIRAAKRVASDLEMYLYIRRSSERVYFCFCWSLPSHYVRFLHLFNAKGSTPLARFLAKDGDYAIMWRVLQFEELKV